jgi:hypothetical protein
MSFIEDFKTQFRSVPKPTLPEFMSAYTAAYNSLNTAIRASEDEGKSLV